MRTSLELQVHVKCSCNGEREELLGWERDIIILVILLD